MMTGRRRVPLLLFIRFRRESLGKHFTHPPPSTIDCAQARSFLGKGILPFLFIPLVFPLRLHIVLSLQNFVYELFFYVRVLPLILRSSFASSISFC